MRLLVDSHVALWWLGDDRSLGSMCRRHLEDADEVFVSAITPWELGIERALGKLRFPDGLIEALHAAGMQPLSVTVEHAQQAPLLPPHHADPFDRMLVAQAQAEALILVTADRALRPYEVPLIDARV